MFSQSIYSVQPSGLVTIVYHDVVHFFSGDVLELCYQGFRKWIQNHWVRLRELKQTESDVYKITLEMNNEFFPQRGKLLTIGDSTTLLFRFPPSLSFFSIEQKADSITISSDEKFTLECEAFVMGNTIQLLDPPHYLYFTILWNKRRLFTVVDTRAVETDEHSTEPSSGSDVQ